MKILDRYIIRNFLYSALLWFVILMAMRIVVDLFVNLDEFASKGKTIGLLTEYIGSYYGYQSLAYFAQLGGVIIVAAATFTLAVMGHTNELTAILASGVSLHRVVWPIIICSILLSGLVAVDQELIIPQVASKLVRQRDDTEGKNEFHIAFVTDGSGAIWKADTFKPLESRLTRPVVFIRDEEYRQIASIFADSARPAEVGGQKGWMMSGKASLMRSYQKDRIWTHTPDVLNIYSQVTPDDLSAFGDSQVSIEDQQYPMLLEAKAFVPSMGKGNPPRLLDPRFIFRTEKGLVLGIFVATAAHWEKTEDGGIWHLEGGELFFPSDLTKEDLVLRRSSHWLDYMSTAQLGELLQLKRVPDPDSARLVRHTRITEPFNNLVMLFLGLPFILYRERRDIKASASLCLLIVGTFYAFVYLCRNVGLPPALAAWLPIMLFGPVSIVMLDSVKT